MKNSILFVNSYSHIVSLVRVICHDSRSVSRRIKPCINNFLWCFLPHSDVFHKLIVAILAYCSIRSLMREIIRKFFCSNLSELHCS